MGGDVGLDRQRRRAQLFGETAVRHEKDADHVEAAILTGVARTGRVTRGWRPDGRREPESPFCLRISASRSAMYTERCLPPVQPIPIER